MGSRVLFLWNVASLEQLGRAMQGHPTGVVAVAFSLDGRSLVSIGQDGTVAQWATDTVSAVGAIFEGLGDGTVHLSFSADGGKLAAASSDRMVRVWDVGTRRLLRAPLGGFQQSLVGVAFTQGGGELLLGTSRQLVEWDLSAARPSAAHCTVLGVDLPRATTGIHEGVVLLAAERARVGHVVRDGDRPTGGAVEATDSIGGR